MKPHDVQKLIGGALKAARTFDRIGDAVRLFDQDCARADYTDTGDAWDLLNRIRTWCDGASIELRGLAELARRNPCPCLPATASGERALAQALDARAEHKHHWRQVSGGMVCASCGAPGPQTAPPRAIDT